MTQSATSQTTKIRALRHLSFAVLSLATLAGLTDCSSGHAASKWATLPLPTASPASVFMGGQGDGTIPVPGSGDLQIGVSCSGAGELNFFNGSTQLGAVQCFKGVGTKYGLSLGRSATSLQVKAPAKVIWEVSVGHAQ